MFGVSGRQKVFRGERKSRPQPQAEPKKLNGTSRLQPSNATLGTTDYGRMISRFQILHPKPRIKIFKKPKLRMMEFLVSYEDNVVGTSISNALSFIFL